ncbi:MAG: RimK family alpha-L-glutamate ligase [Candidatus Bathyarchaeia archaeon]
MKFGLVTRNRNSWSSTQLREALNKHGINHECFSLLSLNARVGYKPHLEATSLNPKELDVLIVRPVGRGSLEELVFRMDMLYKLHRSGIYILNPPEALEHCVDKYDVLTILEEGGVPVPRTMVTQKVDDALKAFNELGKDVVIKPLFGSRGLGSTRIKDPEIALTVFKAITFYHGVIYMQEFLPHGTSDLRAFVIGDQVIAAMRRVAEGWKTNYSQGARPTSVKLDKALEDLAVKSAKLVGCKVAGVDILESQNSPVILEVNSQPGWKGLQSVTQVNIADEIVNFVLSELRK